MKIFHILPFNQQSTNFHDLQSIVTIQTQIWTIKWSKCWLLQLNVSSQGKLLNHINTINSDQYLKIKYDYHLIVKIKFSSTLIIGLEKLIVNQLNLILFNLKVDQHSYKVIKLFG